MVVRPILRRYALIDGHVGASPANINSINSQLHPRWVYETDDKLLPQLRIFMKTAPTCR